MTPSPESFSEQLRSLTADPQRLFRYPLPQEVLKGLTRQLFFFFFSFGENEGGIRVVGQNIENKKESMFLPNINTLTQLFKLIKPLYL